MARAQIIQQAGTDQYALALGTQCVASIWDSILKMELLGILCTKVTKLTIPDGDFNPLLYVVSAEEEHDS